MSTNARGWTCPDDPTALETANVCLSALSKNLDGGMTLTGSREHKCAEPDCTTLTTEHLLNMNVVAHDCDDSTWGPLFDGPFVVQNLVTLFDKNNLGRGLHAGDFTWNGPGVQVVGRISGMTNVGTHRAPAFSTCQKCGDTEVMEGRLCGSVVYAKDPSLKDNQVFGAYRIHFYTAQGSPVQGTFEGVLLRPCLVEG
jgi:hypothetical protein